MSNCPTCKESILSQTPSLIGQTQCTTDCPEDITCVDIIPSNCVFYSGATLSCPSGNTSVNYGDTVTVALGKMYDLICQNSTSNTVQITANDTCYGYLASKITSSSLDITISNPGACEKLNIEEKCWTWSDITFIPGSKWKTSIPPTSQKAQVSNVKECVVRLRGTVYNNTYSSSDKIIFQLPLQKTPSKNRRFSVNISNGVSTVPTNIGFIYIYNTGDVVLEYTQNITGATFVSLDGISFEIN